MRLGKAASSSKFAAETLVQLKMKDPLSLAITVELFRRAYDKKRLSSLQQVLEMDYTILTRLMKQSVPNKNKDQSIDAFSQTFWQSIYPSHVSSNLAQSSTELSKVRKDEVNNLFRARD